MGDQELLYVQPDAAKVERFVAPGDVDDIKIGDWYWLKREDKEFLYCVYHIGSNYAEVRYPGTNYESVDRVHFDDWPSKCRHEPNPEFWFDQWADEAKREIRRLNAEIQDICSRLGVDPKKNLASSPTGCSLSRVSAASDTDAYKSALTKAQKEDLPALFKQIQENSEELSRWMLAGSMSMRASCGDMQEVISAIDDRIFTVSIYAGLVEDVKLIRNGDPASSSEKLRLMQGKLFMDEECLLNYEHGGMEFCHIKDFDAWLSKEDNFGRILPFPRCMVAFQVRRRDKARACDGDLATAWINMELAKLDKLTFLYIRNGDRLYRLNTEIKFGDELFADRDEFNFTEPLMAKDRSNATITVREYESRVQEYLQKRREHKRKVRAWREKRAAYKKWLEQNPEADDDDALEAGFDCESTRPFEQHWFGVSFDPREWTVLNDKNVYMDDVNDRIRKEANQYNRISALIQGLLDRSDVLHPHPKVRLWTPQGFEQFIELVYDRDRTLYDGEAPPSWEEYKAQCNASLGVGSVVTGQQQVWQDSLPVAHCSRTYKPYVPYKYTEGNPGPGFVARIQQWSPKTKTATFRWIQSRYVYRRGYGNSGETQYNRSIKVSADDLFNISGYKLGDYKRFFNDPRTRAQYYKWAHVLLTAEEYHAGNLDPVTLEKPKKASPVVEDEPADSDEE